MKTIFKKYAALIGVLCTVMLVISGCALDDLQTAKGEPGTGTVTLSINGAGAARTIYPKDIEFDHYIVKIFNTDQTQYGVNSRIDTGITTLHLPITTQFKITVDAYVNAGDTTPAASGEATVSNTDLASQGATTSVNINLIPAASGNGTFAWDLTLDASITKAEIKIGNDPAIVIFGTGATKGVRDSVPLAKGEYLVLFTITYNDSSTFTIPEDLYIWAGMTSSFEGEIGSRHFYEMVDYVIGLLQPIHGNWDLRIASLKKEFFDDMNIVYTYQSADYFTQITGQFGTFIGSDISLLPANITDLKALVDAAGIALYIVNRPGDFETQAELETEINLAVAAFNTSHLGYSFTVDHEATITVGHKYHVKTFIVPPATGFDVKIAGTNQTIEVSSMKGNNTTRKAIAGGYEQSQSAGYQSAWSGFQIDLGSRKLSDFASVKVTLEGVSGDVAWKTVTLLAAANIPNYSTPDVASITVSAASNQTPGDNPAAPYSGANITANILQNEAAKGLTGTIDVVLYIPAGETGAAGGAGSPTVFKFTNIEFVLGEPCIYGCDSFPCACEGVLTLTSAWGSGTITGDELAKVRAAPAGSSLRLFIQNNTNPYESRGGWGIGTIGHREGPNRIDFNGLAGVAFTLDISIEAVLTAIDASSNTNEIAINVYNQCSLVRVQIIPPVDTDQPLVVNNPAFESVWGGSATVGEGGWVTWSGGSAAIGWAFPAGYDSYDSIRITYEIRNVVPGGAGDTDGLKNAQIVPKKIPNAGSLSTFEDPTSGPKFPWIGTSDSTGTLTYDNPATEFGQGLGIQLNNSGASFEFRVTKVEFFNAP